MLVLGGGLLWPGLNGSCTADTVGHKAGTMMHFSFGVSVSVMEFGLGRAFSNINKMLKIWCSYCQGLSLALCAFFVSWGDIFYIKVIKRALEHFWEMTLCLERHLIKRLWRLIFLILLDGSQQPPHPFQIKTPPIRTEIVSLRLNFPRIWVDCCCSSRRLPTAKMCIWGF